MRNSPRNAKKNLFKLFVLLGAVLCVAHDQDKSNDDVCTNPENANTNDESCPLHNGPSFGSAVPPSCQLVMAESTIPDSGWGVFTMSQRSRGTPIVRGDVVIQLADVNMTYAKHLKRLLFEYAWDSQETGGFYHGKHQVVSVVPGMGMLANGLATKSNILPYIPQVDEGDLIRTSSPGAGAISHYHNYTFFVKDSIEKGGEVFCNYGKGWFQERQSQLQQPQQARSINWLQENGWCLDNLQSGRSDNIQAGRGAFASRRLPKNSVIAPIPLVVIDHRNSLYTTTRIRPKLETETTESNNIVVEGHQLLLNYCFGHANSSLLLYPYSPIVNFINHDLKTYNAKLTWSRYSTSRGWTSKSLEELRNSNNTRLLLELVATRDITAGEEVVINYGQAWQDAWDAHVENWTPVPHAETYTPAYVMEDVVVSKLRTQQEQKLHPYPENVFTSCFYRYSDNQQQAAQQHSSPRETTTLDWKFTRGLFELRNLRPCHVLERHEVGENVYFTVLIRNRPGLLQEERIPKGTLHIVTKVPRQAIRFSDKIYTTDQDLENAFRHEIQLDNEIFPKQWMDLVE